MATNSKKIFNSVSRCRWEYDFRGDFDFYIDGLWNFYYIPEESLLASNGNGSPFYLNKKKMSMEDIKKFVAEIFDVPVSCVRVAIDPKDFSIRAFMLK